MNSTMHGLAHTEVCSGLLCCRRRLSSSLGAPLPMLALYFPFPYTPDTVIVFCVIVFCVFCCQHVYACVGNVCVYVRAILHCAIIPCASEPFPTIACWKTRPVVLIV